MSNPSLLLVHDHRFPIADGEALDDGRFGDLQRYVRLFDEVTLLARSRQAEESESSNLSSLSEASVAFASVDFRRLIYSRSEMSRLASLVRTNDAIIVRLPSLLGTIVASQASKLRKPVLVEMVGCPWDAYWNHGVRGKVAAPVAFLATRRAVKYADCVIYVTERFLQRRYPTRGRELACSDVQLEQAGNSTLEARIQKIDRFNETKPAILATSAAVDVPYKGQEYVIRAMARLRQPPDKLQYWLIGGGDQTRLRELARSLGLESNVRFFGSTPHNRVIQILRDDVDLYIQPSLQEGMPRALLEAMAIGCPAFGARTGGIPEILDGSSLFDRANADSIFRLINELTPNRVKCNVNRNFAVTSAKFDPKVLSDAWLAFVGEFRDDASKNRQDHDRGIQ